MVAGIHEIARLPISRRRKLGRDLAHWPWPWRRPGWRPRLVAAVLYIAAVAVVLGGSPGIVVYWLLVLSSIALAVSWRGGTSRLLKRLRDLQNPSRAAIETVVVPLWIWSLSPDPIHPRAVFGFLRNRSSDLSLTEALSFYPASFFADYVNGPVVETAVVAALIVGLMPVRRVNPAVRVVALFVGVTLALILLHPYKLSRFLATVMPFLFLLAGFGASRLFHPRGLAELPRRIVGTVGAGLVILAIFATGGSAAHLERNYRARMGEPALAEVLVDVRRLVAHDRRVGIVGTSTELSPPLLEWSLHQRFIDRTFEVVRPLPRLTPDASKEALATRLSRWLTKRRPDQIATIRLTPDSSWFSDPGFRRYDAPQQGAVVRLVESPRWQAKAARSYPALGIELTILEPLDVNR